MLNLDCFDVSYERCSEPCRIVQTHEKGYLFFEWFDNLQFKELFVFQGMDIYKSSFLQSDLLTANNFSLLWQNGISKQVC